MDILKKWFPWSFRANDVKSLIISILIYIAIGIVGGLIISLLIWVPLVGWLLGLVGGLLDLYTLVGIILAILEFAGVLKS